MYQGMQQTPINNYYPTANPYSGPQYQQRLTPIEQPQNPYPVPYPGGGYLKGRPVVSLEEARAAQIDLDGSVYVFTDIGNKKIYTKQFNLDGTATLNVYSLVEGENEDNTSTPQYVTKEEFSNIIAQLQAQINQEKESKPISF